MVLAKSRIGCNMDNLTVMDNTSLIVVVSDSQFISILCSCLIEDNQCIVFILWPPHPAFVACSMKTTLFRTASNETWAWRPGNKANYSQLSL